MSKPLSYRPEIDGLRALAVLAVFAYHLNHAWLPGGYLGVDIFFVISGFLITTIIVRACEVGEFSLREFYLRRARRILPALLTVTCLSLIAGYLLLFPDELRVAARACKKALLCYSNYYFARGDGYFDPSSESNPFLHTWSLGVEEQFYFAFPLLVAVLHRAGKLKARYIGGFVVFGILLSTLMTRSWPTHAFFALESRAWELAAGAWLAIAVERGTLLRFFSMRFVGEFSLGLMLLGLVFFRRCEWTPAPLALPVILGAVLFVGSRAGGSNSPVSRLFSSAPMRFIGRISYVLYLVHWPLIVYAQARFGDLTPGLMFGVLVLSFLLATLIHIAIETPLRHGTRTRWFLGTMAALVLGLIGLLDVVVDRKGAINPAMTAALVDILPEAKSLERDPRSPYRIGDTRQEPTLGLWGDSHAIMYMRVLDEELKARGICCEVWAQSGNLPAVGVKLKGQARVINDEALASFSRPQIRGVILSARWSSYNRGKPEDYETGPRIVGAKTAELATEHMRTALDTTIARLSSSGRKVVLVYPLPEAGVHIPYLLARKLAQGDRADSLYLEKPALEYASRHDLTLPLLDEICRKYGLSAIHPERRLLTDKGLWVADKGLSLYLDDDHLSRYGAKPVVLEVLQVLGETGGAKK